MDAGQTALAATIPLFHLNESHARPLVGVFRRILATKTAEDSFGMLMDGRLTLDELMQCRLLKIGEDRDEIEKYTGPTHESIRMFRSLRERFEPSDVLLKADVRRLKTYRYGQTDINKKIARGKVLALHT